MPTRHARGRRITLAIASVIGSCIVLATPAADATPGNQLVVNPGFDNGFVLPWWEGGNPDTYETRIDRGQACFDVAGNVNVVDPSVGQGDLSLIAGRSYLYSFDASASVPAEISTSIALEPAPHTIWLDREIRLDRGQRRFSFPFVAPTTTAQGAVIFRMGGNPVPVTVCLDNVTLLDADAVTNGTFDNGTTDWWNNPRADVAVEAGALRVTARENTTDVFGVQVGQGYRALRPGQRYVLSFDARASVDNAPVRVDVQQQLAPFTADLAWPVTLDRTTRRFRVEFTATMSPGQSQIAFQLGGRPAGTVFWLDNVSLVEQPTANDPILFWNTELLTAYRLAGGAPGPLSRSGAMLHGAVYDALNSIVPIGQPYITRVPPPSTVFTSSPDVAVHQAAFTVLRSVFPDINFQPALDRAMATVPSGVNQQQRTQGTHVGMTAAIAMLNARANDGSANNTPYIPDNVPGAWRSTGHLCPVPVTPNWGLVRPFALTSGAQFRPPNPGGFTTYGTLLASSLYATQVQEVRELGQKVSTRRTAEQTQIAFFWANDLDGTYKPPGQHFEHTRIVSQQRGLTTVQNARLFGLVAIAMADAAIAAWDRKYLTNIDLWRPDTAIEFAPTNPDRSWEPLSQDTAGISFSPCFPAYTSGHATFGAAWAGTMRAFLGTDELAFTGTTDDPHARGVTRTFTGFTAAANEDALSRIYLGVHFRFDADFGLISGTSVAEHVFGTVLRP